VLGNRLSLQIFDPNGAHMYGATFPIEVTEIYLAGGCEKKPPSERFQNEIWIDKAIDVVTDYLPRMSEAAK
jgi:hypothetical protein